MDISKDGITSVHCLILQAKGIAPSYSGSCWAWLLGSPLLLHFLASNTSRLIWFYFSLRHPSLKFPLLWLPLDRQSHSVTTHQDLEKIKVMLEPLQAQKKSHSISHNHTLNYLLNLHSRIRGNTAFKAVPPTCGLWAVLYLQDLPVLLTSMENQEFPTKISKRKLYLHCVAPSISYLQPMKGQRPLHYRDININLHRKYTFPFLH